MTTSFTRTREQLGAMVARKLKVLASGATANSNDLTIIYEAVDLRLKEMHRLGIFWRKVTIQPVAFSISSAATASAGVTDVLFPIKMTVLDSDDEPVRIIDIREYAAIEDKAETGIPTKALWLGGADFVFHPIHTSSTTAKLVYEKIADDTVASTAPDVDVAMLRWLKDIIAYDLGDEFGHQEGTMLRWAKDAMRAELNIKKLASQRVDFSTVPVDEFVIHSESNTKRDWNTN